MLAFNNLILNQNEFLKRFIVIFSSLEIPHFSTAFDRGDNYIFVHLVHVVLTADTYKYLQTDSSLNMKGRRKAPACII